jgi:hypothetical protein
MEYIPGIAAERQRELKERAARLAAAERAKKGEYSKKERSNTSQKQN